MTCLEIKEREGVTVGISHLPGRTRYALYFMRGAHIEPAAYFMRDEDAERFIDLLERLCAKANGEKQ